MKKENLHILSVTKYNNGDPILEAQNFEEWKKFNNSQEGAYCRYANDEDETGHILYNWFALNDSRRIIPEGMKLATSEVWNSIESELENDESLQGFLKNGKREHFGFFVGNEKAGYYWSDKTDERNNKRAIFFSILSSGGNEIFEADCDKRLGLSILCVKE